MGVKRTAKQSTSQSTYVNDKITRHLAASNNLQIRGI